MVDAVEERTIRQNEGVALNIALGVDREEVLQAMQGLIGQLTEHPKIIANVWQNLSIELAAITMGFSTIDTGKEDCRFRDQAYSDNPFYSRIGQSYIASRRSMDEWLDQVELEGMDDKRARFLLGIFKDIMAPVNNLYGNPSALQTLFDTRGQSLANGLKNFLDDLKNNYGYPAVADRDGFKIGQDVAASIGSVIYKDDVIELMQYEATTKKVNEMPFLYVFSQVNRFYLGDLTLDRSLFQEILAQGIRVFAISWRNPTVDQRDWNIDTYCNAVIKAVDVMREITGQDKVNVMGLCAGGITTATALGLMNARGDDFINSHSLFVNILDNRPEDSDFGLFLSEQSIEAQKSRVQAKGIFDEKDVFEMFAILTPEESVMSFYRDNWLVGKPPPIHPLLFWSMDYTRVPAGLQCDMLDLAWENKLAKGDFKSGGKRIQLNDIKYDTYIMAGSTDNITPWRGCYRTTQLYGGNVEFVLTNQNHTQTISNKPNPYVKYWIAGELPEDPEEWMSLAVEFPGSWREHWIAWLKERSGDEVDAIKVMGSDKYQILDKAPGRYVVDS
jgi:polyhydroxyalkanoate synthase